MDKSLETVLPGLLEAAGMLVLSLDDELRVTAAGRAAGKLTGIKAEQLCGHLLEEVLIEPAEAGLAEQMLRHSLAQRVPVSFKVRSRGGLLQLRHLACTAVPLPPEAQPARLALLFSDATELKELEDRLLHAEKLLSVGEMTAGIAHELKNYFTMLSTQTQLLNMIAGRLNDQDLSRNLTNISANIERAFRLVANLVNYSRAGVEKAEPGNFNDLMEAALNLCEFLLRKNNIQVERRYSRELPAVVCEQGRLEQVLVNLILNAVQAMKGKGGTLTLTTQPLDESRFRWEVRDTGVGMTEDIREKVFEPFFTTKPAGEGTGLGLTMVKRVLEEHGAVFGFESKPGEGAVFYAVMPLRRK